MKEGPNIVGIAALIGDHARAEVLTALMSGKALTATELADVAGVTKQTMGGAALMQRIIELGWAKRVSDSRVIEFSVAGEQALRKIFTVRGNSYADIQHDPHSEPGESSVFTGPLSLHVAHPMLTKQ